MQSQIDVSIIIPLLDEEESLSTLTDWVLQSLKEEEYVIEIIFVDDGSQDKRWKILVQ
jgi:glycosyltransferase involved in cell wall biosynthesis